MLFSAGKAVYHLAILFRRMGFSQLKKKKKKLTSWIRFLGRTGGGAGENNFSSF